MMDEGDWPDHPSKGNSNRNHNANQNVIENQYKGDNGAGGSDGSEDMSKAFVDDDLDGINDLNKAFGDDVEGTETQDGENIRETRGPGFINEVEGPYVYIGPNDELEGFGESTGEPAPQGSPASDPSSTQSRPGRQ